MVTRLMPCVVLGLSSNLGRGGNGVYINTTCSNGQTLSLIGTLEDKCNTADWSDSDNWKPTISIDHVTRDDGLHCTASH